MHRVPVVSQKKMATDDLLPLFQQGNRDPDIGSLLGQDPSLQIQDDSLISELLAGQGDDLLSSLLESTVCLPPNTSPDNFTSLNFDLDPTHVLYPQNSPLTSDGYVSDSSTLHKASSPASCSTVSDQLGTSPVCDGTSPRHSPLVSSSVLEPPGTTEDIGTLLGLGDVMEPRLGNVMEPRLGDVMEPRLGDGMELRLGDGMEPRITSTAESLSRDVRIDVEPVGLQSIRPDLKAATLVLSEEEKRLLAEEGLTLPTDMVLTKAEQKHLKRIRRKIKNKISAKESRQRKKDYVEGLEERVERCTTVNQRLIRRIDSLESENKSMLTQLKKLQAIVLQYNPSRLQAGTLVMVLVLSFSLFFVPLHFPRQGGDYRSIRVHSRSLLFTDTDVFGNVVDPESGRVISTAGGQSPTLFPPWVDQTPAFNLFNRSLQEGQNHRRHDSHLDRPFLPP